MNLLKIDRKTFKQLHIDGMTLKFYDTINHYNRLKPFDNIDDVISFFINYRGRIMNRNHIKMWKYKNTTVKINNILIDMALYYKIKNRLKYLKYNKSEKGQQRYKIYDNTKKCKQKYKKYNNTRKVANISKKYYQIHCMHKQNNHHVKPNNISQHSLPVHKYISHSPLHKQKYTQNKTVDVKPYCNTNNKLLLNISNKNKQKNTKKKKISRKEWLQSIKYLHYKNKCKHKYNTRSKIHKQRSFCNNAQKFYCQLCFKPFYTKMTLERHQKIHNGQYECNRCSIRFTRSCLRTFHIKKIHTNETQKFNVQKFHCGLCFKSCGSMRMLQRHQSVHNGPYKCDFCGMGFTRWSTRTFHISLIHNKEIKSLRYPIAIKLFNTHI